MQKGEKNNMKAGPALFVQGGVTIGVLILKMLTFQKPLLGQNLVFRGKTLCRGGGG